MIISKFSWLDRENGKYNVQRQYSTKHKWQEGHDPQKKHRPQTLSKKIPGGIGILGQLWYLIVSIPDLCTLTYFHMFDGTKSHPYFWCGSRQINIWFEWNFPNLSMYHYVQK